MDNWAEIIVPVTTDSYNVAVASILRTVEETGATRVTILHSRRADSNARGLRDLLARPGILEIELKEVSEHPGEAVREIRRLIRRKARSSRLYVLPTPGSRRLAAALAMAGLGDACILHVDFYWGLWFGLPYPLVPRVFEPVYTLQCSDSLPARLGDEEAQKVTRLLSVVGEALCSSHKEGEEETLRGLIAREVLRINRQRVTHRLIYGDGGGVQEYCESRALVFEYRIGGPGTTILVEVKDWCNDDSWIAAAEKVLRSIKNRADEWLRELLCAFARLAGLFRLYIVQGSLRQFLEGDTVIDTNLIYWGIHNDCMENRRLRLLIPYAVEAELFRRKAEALKPLLEKLMDCIARGSPGSECRRVSTALQDLAASEAYRELRKYCRSAVTPSPAPPADTAIPSMDILLLQGRCIATADYGAFNFWTRHPVSNIATPVLLASREPWNRSDIEKQTMAADAAYALFQLAAILRRLGKLVCGENRDCPIGARVRESLR